MDAIQPVVSLRPFPLLALRQKEGGDPGVASLSVGLLPRAAHPQ